MDDADPVSRDEAEVLSYLVGDHYGLWEVVEILKGDRALAKSVLAALLARGWIELLREGPTGERGPLSPSERVESLADEAAWQVDPEVCWATTTAAGDAAYFAIPEQSWAEHRRGA